MAPIEMASLSRRRRVVHLLLILSLAVAACGADAQQPDPGNGDAGASDPSRPTSPVATGGGSPDQDPLLRLAARFDEVEDAVRRWATADDVDEARQAAQQAAALIAGSREGEPDGDGVEVGVLPARDGDPAGLALVAVEAGAPRCVTDDVLGGSWSEPGGRWQELDDVLSRWRSDRNTMPELASHAQRVVGWSRLTTGTDRLDLARTYAGHATIHVDVMRRALTSCGER